MTNDQEKIPVFIDGICVLCNGFAQWLLKRDHSHRFSIGALQGETARQQLPPADLDGLHSIVVKHERRILQRSDAVLFILSELGGLYRVLSYLRLIPRPVRDFVYDFVAKIRYKVFGSYDHCTLPNADDRSRLLD